MRKPKHKVTEKDIQYITKYINQVPAKAIAEALDMSVITVYRILQRLGVKLEKRNSPSVSKSQAVVSKGDYPMVTCQGKTQSVEAWIKELNENYQTLCSQIKKEELPSRNSINHRQLCESLLRSNSILQMN